MLDWYTKLKTYLSTNGQEQLNQKYIEQENDGDKWSLIKTLLETHRTFIELETEAEEECNSLRAADEDHIILTDWNSTPNMKAIAGTKSMYQLTGDSQSTPSQRWNLHTVSLTWLFPLYQSNLLDIIYCLYKTNRDIKTVAASEKRNKYNDNSYPPHGISKLTVAALNG